MADKGERSGEGSRPAGGEERSRPQQAGEAATTRFGMEEGDNSDIPATGGPAPDGDDEEQAT